MTVMQAVLGFGAIAVVITLIPGLDVTLVLRTALVRGRRHGLAAALGICTGAMVWGAGAAVGAAALLAASRAAYAVVTVAGAAYMVYLGISMIVKSFRAGAGHLDLAAVAKPVTSWRAFLTGAWTDLLNPKMGVFYVATIPQFIPAGASHLGMGLLLAGVHVLIAMTWFLVLIVGASLARRWLASVRALRAIDRIAGAVLIAFGARLALQHRL